MKVFNCIVEITHDGETIRIPVHSLEYADKLVEIAESVFQHASAFMTSPPILSKEELYKGSIILAQLVEHPSIQYWISKKEKAIMFPNDGATWVHV
jgi:hypothetical protein